MVVSAAAAIHIQIPAFHWGWTKHAMNERQAIPIGSGRKPATLMTAIDVKTTATLVKTTVVDET
jgi:hypothetical protein